MKRPRHGPVGAEMPGALDADGRASDLSLLVADFTPDWMALAKLQGGPLRIWHRHSRTMAARR